MSTLLEVLRQHRKHNSSDKRIFGLVLQGGGMRGAYTAGTMIPLIMNNLGDSTFEHIIGSSAGGINAAYLIDNHVETMVAFTDDLSNKNFVNLVRTNKLIDIDYAVDEVLRLRHPIDKANLKKAYSKLHIVLTDAHTGKKVVISDHHRFTNIYEEFRATAAIPILYDQEVLLDGTYYLDGGVADLVPIDVAIDLGCTDIVVIMTQQVQSYRFDDKHTRLVKHLIRKFAKHQTEAVKKVLPTDQKLLQKNLRRAIHPTKKIRTYLLEPSNQEALISMGTIDKEKVNDLAQIGITDCEAFLTKEVD
jgi:predicted patatin/cPLA2 family phospholipase